MKNTTVPERRGPDGDFIARGLRSRDEARRTGEYVGGDEVMTKLRAMTAEAKKKKKSPAH